MDANLQIVTQGKNPHFRTLTAEINNNRRIELLYQPELCLTPDSITVAQAIYASRVSNQEGFTKVMELGVGSGVFLCYMLLNSQHRHLDVRGIDIDDNALRIAHYNLQQVVDLNGLPRTAYSVAFGDWLHLNDSHEFPNVDLIYCNPPYLPFGTRVRPASVDNPAHALFAENDGLLHYGTIIRVAISFLRPNGYLFLRISNAEERIDPVLHLINELMPYSESRLLDFSSEDRRGKGIWIRYHPSPN